MPLNLLNQFTSLLLRVNFLPQNLNTVLIKFIKNLIFLQNILILLLQFQLYFSNLLLQIQNFSNFLLFFFFFRHFFLYNSAFLSQILISRIQINNITRSSIKLRSKLLIQNEIRSRIPNIINMRIPNPKLFTLLIIKLLFLLLLFNNQHFLFLFIFFLFLFLFLLLLLFFFIFFFFSLIFEIFE